MGTFNNVIMVGAGPSGLLLSLLLTRHGIPVTILEAASALDQQPRAAHYGPPAMPELRRAGVLDKIRARGLTLNTMCWRDPEEFSVMAGIDQTPLADVDGLDERTTCLVLQELDQLLLDETLEVQKVRGIGGGVRFGHKVVDIGESKGKAWVDVEVEGRKERFEADYVVGCDGANSQIRRSLFGDTNYPGYTWDTHQIVATNTYFDFKKYGWYDANFIIHPQHFFMAAVIQKDGLYRITYGEEPGLSREELQARMEWKFKTMLPGNPDPSQYKVLNFSPYRMHQRCAPAFRRGRFLLAADAAHLCNVISTTVHADSTLPWGGMGITGGFVDIGGLYDCLAGLWDGKADEDILDLYSQIRIEKWKTVIDPISSENFKRVHDSDPKTRVGRDPFMQMCKKAEGDKEFAREMLLGGFAVQYDFTQHYKDRRGIKDFLDKADAPKINGLAQVPQPAN